MNAIGDREKFELSCDWSSKRARIAIIGSQGTEVLVAFPMEDLALADHDEAQPTVYKEGELRLRAALMGFIGKNWPK